MDFLDLDVCKIDNLLSNQDYDGFYEYMGTKPDFDSDGVLIGFINKNGSYTTVVYSDEKIEEKKAVVPIERVRRITGYLTGSVDKWGSAKQAELRDRVKHI